MMLTQQSIRDFLAQSDYDIRESGNGRWIDQKCTPDVVCAVADFICNYVADDPSPGSCPFTSKEIWHSEYASQYVEAVFKKPTLKNKNACLLYTSDAADEEDSVDLGGRRILKKKKK